MRRFLAALAFLCCVFAAIPPEPAAEEVNVEVIDDAALQLIAGTLIMIFFMFGFVLYYFIFNKSADEAVSGMKELDRPAQFTDKNKEG